MIMSRARLLVHSLWRLYWSSSEANHEEELLVPFHPWREGELCPPEIARFLENSRPGERFTLSLAPGDLIPPHRADLEISYPLSRFDQGRRLPRQGRFYPKHLLNGYFENFTPFRCLAVDGRQFLADFNHPLAGRDLTLEVIVTEIREKSGAIGGECRDWLEILTTGPGLQARSHGRPTDFFGDDPFRREDETEDSRFYQQPRLVSHVDLQCQALISLLSSRLLRPGMRVLDLMSSWQSHLPAGLKLERLVGLGLNAAELQHNPRLTERVVQDLNLDPRLPFSTGQFDAVVCHLSVEYLIRPFEVFREVARVLRPGGVFLVTFSHRWFPPKVVKIWTELHEFERLGLVVEYFLESGAFGRIHTFSSRGWPRPESDRYYPRLKTADPLFAVWGERQPDLQ